MKEVKKMTMLLLLACVITASFKCSKKETAPSTCKTCKAFNAGVDGGTVSKQVCTDAEEAAFRSEHSGNEISCQ